MLTIYLDQNKWVDLRRARFGDVKGEPFRDVLDLAMHARKESFASFPLGVAHYLETWKDHNEARRAKHAQVMAELSRFDAIAGPRVVFPSEIDAALQHFFGRPETLSPLKIYGRGFAHAFGTDSDIRIPEVPEVPRYLREQVHHEVWTLKESWVLSLYTPDESIPVPDPSAYTKYSDEFQDAEQQLVEIMKNERASKHDREELALIRTLVDVIHLAAEPCAKAGVSLDALIGLGKDGLWDFLQMLPTRIVDFEMQRLRYQNLGLPRKNGDLLDIGFLGTAVAYCDVVVTEKSWCDLISRTTLCERFNTRVLSDLRDLGPILARGA